MRSHLSMISIWRKSLNWNLEVRIVSLKYLSIIYTNIALTKKLIEKVKSEWETSLKKKEDELSEDKKNELELLKQSF